MLSRRAARLLAEPPLNKTLRRVLAGEVSTHAGGYQRTKPLNINKDPKYKIYSRTEIVSEKLCDDILTYLSPTLKPYRGCTILDVHPGACLWSRKLHEFLKPRCHILMEPDDLYTKEFIKPLLSKRNSKYRHCKLPFVHDDSWSYIHPYAQALDAVRGPGMRNIPTLSTSLRDYDDPRLRLIDANILMTGNLARVYQKKNPIHIIHKELQSALDNTGLHRNGLVRQLWWIPDNFKNRSALVPQVLTGRNSGTVMTAIAADVSQVVGVDPSTNSAGVSSSTHRVRNSLLDAENRRQVNARAHVAGIWAPGERKLLIPSNMEINEQNEDEEENEGVVKMNVRQEEVVEPRDPFTIQHHSLQEVSKAITDFDKFLDTIRVASSINWDKSTVDELVDAIEYPQCLPAAIETAAQPHNRTVDNLSALTQRRAIYLDIMLRMINLETHVVVLRDQQKVNISQLQTRLSKLDKEIRRIMKSAADSSQTLVEDQQIHFSQPQNWLYDRRNYEPLLASKNEFWPKTPLALYDCLPTDTDLDVEDIAPRSEVLKLSRELSKQLYVYKAHSLPAALDRIAPNAAQDLIPKVPELTDPRLGGRLDPKNVVMRMVGKEGFEGLVRAWFEWPFKPDRYDLEISSMGNRNMHGGAAFGEKE